MSRKYSGEGKKSGRSRAISSSPFQGAFRFFPLLDQILNETYMHIINMLPPHEQYLLNHLMARFVKMLSIVEREFSTNQIEIWERDGPRNQLRADIIRDSEDPEKDLKELDAIYINNIKSGYELLLSSDLYQPDPDNTNSFQKCKRDLTICVNNYTRYLLRDKHSVDLKEFLDDMVICCCVCKRKDDLIRCSGCYELLCSARRSCHENQIHYKLCEEVDSIKNHIQKFKMSNQCAYEKCLKPYVSRKLMCCSGCNIMQYCDARCQRSDWSKHKTTCERKDKVESKSEDDADDGGGENKNNVSRKKKPKKKKKKK
jgi:MYND finger